MDLREAIRSSYVATGLSETHLESLYDIATSQVYETGAEIIKQFDQNRNLLILASGTADILTVVGEPIGRVKPGMPMGEVSFLDGRPRSGTAIANEPCEAVNLPAEPLLKLLQENPDMAAKILWNISTVLCHRLRTTNNNLAALMALEESDAVLGRP